MSNIAYHIKSDLSASLMIKPNSPVGWRLTDSPKCTLADVAYFSTVASLFFSYDVTLSGMRQCLEDIINTLIVLITSQLKPWEVSSVEINRSRLSSAECRWCILPFLKTEAQVQFVPSCPLNKHNEVCTVLQGFSQWVHHYLWLCCNLCCISDLLILSSLL